MRIACGQRADSARTACGYSMLTVGVRVDAVTVGVRVDTVPVGVRVGTVTVGV